MQTMNKMCRLTADGVTREYPAGTTYEQAAEDFQSQYNAPIVLAKKGGQLIELRNLIPEEDQVTFVTTEHEPGLQTYQRSAVFLTMKAFYDLVDPAEASLVTEFSASKGLYMDVYGKLEITQEFLDRLSARMHELVEADLPITKRVLRTAEAIELFRSRHMLDKENLFRCRRASTVNLYGLDSYEDYFYGYMLPRTGLLNMFELHKYDAGFVLQLPCKESPTAVPLFAPSPKVFNTLQENTRWAHLMHVRGVSDLNDTIISNNMGELIMIQEALMEKKIADIASTIAADPRKRIVLIAGPSSSGKTSFSYRLSVQLKALGLKPHPIAVDNYFGDREKCPRDENGEYDFEALECVDLKLFNDQMNALLAGEEVKLPTYNFIEGKQEFRGNTLKLGDHDILVIEGIHSLNDKMTYDLPADCRFRIYISALTQLNVDAHNRIATTDGRLIRRIVRDARTRGYTARMTIARWASVRKGEEKNIFPYQESADVVFNSALIYELSVLKAYAEPLLFSVPRDCEEYIEAKRLLKFFDYFLPVSGENVPHNSLLREFMGGSVFPVG